MLPPWELLLFSRASLEGLASRHLVVLGGKSWDLGNILKDGEVVTFYITVIVCRIDSRLHLGLPTV